MAAHWPRPLCPAGTTSTADRQSCVACPPGSYAPKVATAACAQCRRDTVAPSSGATACTPCSGATPYSWSVPDSYLYLWVVCYCVVSCLPGLSGAAAWRFLGCCWRAVGAAAAGCRWQRRAPHSAPTAARWPHRQVHCVFALCRYNEKPRTVCHAKTCPDYKAVGYMGEPFYQRREGSSDLGPRAGLGAPLRSQGFTPPAVWHTPFLLGRRHKTRLCKTPATCAGAPCALWSRTATASAAWRLTTATAIPLRRYAAVGAWGWPKGPGTWLRLGRGNSPPCGIVAYMLQRMACARPEAHTGHASSLP